MEGALHAWRRRERPIGCPVPRVLVAEDDEDRRALLAWTFRQTGCEVTECTDGPDLVANLAAHVLSRNPALFELVVSVIRLPGATALEILGAMGGCARLPPVILVTAFPSEDTLAAARRLGVTAVFEKPFELGDLVAKSHDLLEQLHGDMT